MDYKNFIQLTLAQGVKLSISQAIKEGFQHLGRSLGNYVLFTIVMFFITMMASLFTLFIPLIGGFAVGILVTPALMMGYALFARKVQLNQSPSFEHFFDAFKTNFTQLILVNLVIQLVLMGLSSLMIIPIFADLMDLAQSGDFVNDPEMAQELVQEFFLSMVKNWWLLAIYAIVAMVIQILYLLANYFVVFYGFGFWEAMEASRHIMAKVFFQVIIINILMGIIMVVGTIFTLGFGLLFLIPASVLVNYSIFEQVAGFAPQETEIEEDLIV